MASIVNCILNDENRIMPISNYDELSGTYNGYPAVLGANGVVRRLGLKINGEEQDKLNHSIQTLRDAIKEVEE
jgi:malate/lactate dehydrogenase